MKNQELKGFVLMLIATLLWGSSFAVTKVTSNIPTTFLVGFRLLIGGIVIALIYKNRLNKINKRLIICSIILGVLYGGGILIQSYGIIYTTAGRGAFLSSDTCVFMPLIELLILKSQLKFKQCLAALVCFVGIGLVAVSEELTIAPGDILSIISGILFAIEIGLLSKYMKEGHDEMLLNSFLLVTGGLMCLIICLFKNDIPQNINLLSIGGIFYLGAFCGGIPLVFEASALTKLKPTAVSIMLGFCAVFGAVFSAIFLKETFTLRNVIGFVLIFGSALISVFDKKQKGDE